MGHFHSVQPFQTVNLFCCALDWLWDIMRSLKVRCRAAADVYFKHFSPYLRQILHVFLRLVSLCTRLAACIRLQASLLLSAPRLPCVCCAETHLRVLQIVIFFLIFFTHSATLTQNTMQQLDASLAQVDWLDGCCWHAAVRVRFSRFGLCCSVTRLRKLLHFMLPFASILLSLLCLQSGPFATLQTHYLVKQSALKIPIEL